MGFAEDMSPLGNASALDCANYCVAMFSDLTRKLLCKTCLMTVVSAIPEFLKK
jgi:hypothetical protein